MMREKNGASRFSMNDYLDDVSEHVYVYISTLYT